MMFNKPKHIKEPHRVGKPSESLRFKNKLIKNMNNSACDSIRNIIEEGENVASQPQLEKQKNEHFKSHKRYNHINLNKKYNGSSFMINSLQFGLPKSAAYVTDRKQVTFLVYLETSLVPLMVINTEFL